MPLSKSKSKSTIAHNIKEMLASGHARDQSIAESLDEARRHKAGGGAAEIPRDKSSIKTYAGPLSGPTGGRTDRLNLGVENGSFVLPADFVSHMGENSTEAGFRAIKRIFAGVPYDGKVGPYTNAQRPYSAPEGEYDKSKDPYDMASGGNTNGKGKNEHVPVVVASGEYILHPEEVKWAGDGDLETGHKVLDKWVMETRKEHIKTLKKLAPPKKK